jgi:hypothetical protein
MLRYLIFFSTNQKAKQDQNIKLFILKYIKKIKTDSVKLTNHFFFKKIFTNKLTVFYLQPTFF